MLNGPQNAVLRRPSYHCGRMFEPPRPHQKHCKPSCRMAAFKTARDRVYTHRAPSMLAPDLLAVGFPVGDAMEYDRVRCRLAVL